VDDTSQDAGGVAAAEVTATGCAARVVAAFGAATADAATATAGWALLLTTIPFDGTDNAADIAAGVATPKPSVAEA